MIETSIEEKLIKLLGSNYKIVIRNLSKEDLLKILMKVGIL